MCTNVKFLSRFIQRWGLSTKAALAALILLVLTLVLGEANVADAILLLSKYGVIMLPV